MIFTNWSIGKYQEELSFGYGLDFGWSIDPDALIKVAVDKKKQTIYAKQLLYKTGQSNAMLIKELRKHVKEQDIIIADSAEGRLINEIRLHGFNIKPTKKKQGSVKEGIRIVQDYHIVVDEDSIDLIKELNNYKWHDKRSETPIDAYNHLLDALRYYVQSVTTNTGRYIIE